MNKTPVLKKCFRGLIIAASIIYALALLYLLLLRNPHTRFSEAGFLTYLRYSVNLVPFKTIAEYITRIQAGTINLSTALANLFGNLVLFLPAGFLLPCLWKRLRRFGGTFLTVLCVILAVECLQLLLRIGSFDIDDFILNLAGASLGYAGFAGFAMLSRLLRPRFPRDPES